MARCLVVDDNPDVREILCLMLQRLGQQTVGLEEGKAALAEIASQEFDVTFTDMCMPDMSGADLIRAARKMKLNTRFVLMTGGTAPLEMRYDYIDAALAPESGLFFIEDYGWGSANREAYALADPEAIAAQGYDDPEQFLQTTVVLSPMPPATTEKIAIMFDEVKAGF